MEGSLVLYPMFAMVGWTFVVTIVMIIAALKAVNDGLNPEYFRYSRGFKVPDYMQSAYHQYGNLFEMPLLFYVATIVTFITASGSSTTVIISWAYVASRALHSLLHLNNRNVPRRRDAFLLSTVLLMALWAVVIWRATNHCR